jgi:hypothetical protein
VRGIAALVFVQHVRVGVELELVRPDDPRGRGSLWPWALGSVGWHWTSGWEVAAAVEASYGLEFHESVNTLARLSYEFDAPVASGRSR